MQERDGRRIFSASDLVGYAACEHLTQLELAALRGEVERPQRFDPFLDILARKGDEHEAALLAAYLGFVDARRVEGGDDEGDLDAAAARTIEHMHAGEPVVYQAVFLHDGWIGYADFLERVDGDSELGPWSYEVVDAKLARAVRAAAVVQLCEYSEHVARIQGSVPRHVHVVTGDALRHTFRLADFAAYHRMLKQRFVATVGGADVETYPEPVDHCAVCRWWGQCRDRRRADDHLSLVAFLGRDQTRRLVDGGIATRTALAEVPPGHTPPAMNRATFERLRLQAALQVRGQGCTPPLWELVEPAEEDDGTARGFGALPAPSPGDLFLDLEGDPYAADGGIFYLFGVVEVVDGAPEYTAYWAHTKQEEREAFRAVVQRIMQRRAEHPGMHVYHYAPAEPSAFKHLMGAHGICEDDVDTMLRAQVFVDCYRVVRQAIRCSTESYSLKEIERLYWERPPAARLDAGAIIAYERYLLEPDAARLDEIATYNRADCESLVWLRQWLEARRVDAEAQFGAIARPAPPDPEDLKIPPDDNGELAAALLATLPDDFLFSRAASDNVEVASAAVAPAPAPGASADDEARYLLAHLLEWHRREAKPAWWWFFERRDKYEPEQFVDDKDCIGGLELVEELEPAPRSARYRLRFPVQEHKLSAGAQPHVPMSGGSAGTIEEIGDTSLVLRRAANRRDEPLPRSLMPGGAIGTDAQRVALAEVARWVLDHAVDADGRYRAVRDLLLRRAPRLPGVTGTEPLRLDGEDAVDAACRIVLALRHGCLAVQGPPGTGKTHTGAHMIVALLRAGKRVGITATTHNAITGLLAKVIEDAGKAGVDVRAIQKPGDDGVSVAHDDVRITKEAAAVEAALAGGDVNLAAGTGWLWARPGLREQVDVLFVDEAGQMSLADAVAVGTAAHNLVLLGDPQQLAQVSQGAHPVGAGVSALQHLLGDHDTIPAHLGLFLDRTWRMHPAVCRFVSEIAYDDRLTSIPDAARQMVDDASGLWFVEVAHDGDATRSRAEAAAVAALFSGLLGREWINEKGEKCTVSLADLIVVAPYNAHVAELRAALPAGARVGTVDKFQGQEGAVAIYSTASSSVDDAPRGLGFLYDLHRLNVAVSRARARAYIVASPELLRANCRSPKELRLANALCRYAELATGESDWIPGRDSDLQPGPKTP